MGFLLFLVCESSRGASAVRLSMSVPVLSAAI